MLWLACFSMLSMAAALESSAVLDLESVRQMIHTVLDNGEYVNDETLDNLSVGYSDSIRAYLEFLRDTVANSKSLSELYVIDQLSDLQVVRDALISINQYGKLDDSLVPAMLSLSMDASRQLLQSQLRAPIVYSEQTISIINQVLHAGAQFLQSATENLADDLSKFASSLPVGHVKTFFTNIHSAIIRLESVEEVDGNAAVMFAKMSSDEAEDNKSQVDKMLNKQTVRYIVSLLPQKEQAIELLDELLSREYDSDDLPAILTALRKCVA